MHKNKGIIETRYYSNIHGMKIVDIEVGAPLLGTFSTKIAQWKGNGKFQLNLRTTPKCGLIETNKDFKNIKEAKKYYLDNLKMFLEDTLNIAFGT